MAQPIIKELWMLWNPTIEDFAIAADDPDPFTAYLCAKSFEAAVAIQIHQQNLYEIKLVPIQVK